MKNYAVCVVLEDLVEVLRELVKRGIAYDVLPGSGVESVVVIQHIEEA